MVLPRVPQDQNIRVSVILERLDKLGEYLEFFKQCDIPHSGQTKGGQVD